MTDDESRAPGGQMQQERSTRMGFGLALISAATFGTSGTFASALIEAGWSPGAAVTIRISIAALILAVPAVIMLRGRWNVLRRNLGMVTVYGLVAIAGCQVFYFNAVQHLSVGVVGLVLILDLIGDTHIDFVGVLWGLGAAVGLAVFFILSARSDSELPPLAMAGGGMTIGAITLLVLGAIGALPMTANTDDVDLAGGQVSWLVPVIGLSVIAAALAYVVGISAARILGSKLASFVGLTEVLFAVLFAWLFLGQLPTGMQLVGGVLIVAGVALVRVDELRGPSDPRGSSSPARINSLEM